MRMILFFDLPTVTDANKRTYRKFHNYLLSEGFIMMQYSVYMKLTLNATSYKLKLSQFYVLYTTKLNQIQFGP